MQGCQTQFDQAAAVANEGHLVQIDTQLSAARTRLKMSRAPRPLQGTRLVALAESPFPFAEPQVCIATNTATKTLWRCPAVQRLYLYRLLERQLSPRLIL